MLFIKIVLEFFVASKMASLIFSDPDKIFRKLSDQEISFEWELKNKSCILTFSMIIDSEYDLLSNIDTFEKAVHIWKTLHPLLRSKIVVDKQFEGQEFPKELYFEEVDEKKLMSHDNIEYLRVITGSSKSISNKSRAPWELLQELEHNIDPNNSGEGKSF